MEPTIVPVVSASADLVMLESVVTKFSNAVQTEIQFVKTTELVITLPVSVSALPGLFTTIALARLVLKLVTHPIQYFKINVIVMVLVSVNLDFMDLAVTINTAQVLA